MRKVNIGIIRVLTLENEQKDSHGKLLEQYFPFYNTTSFCIEDQPHGIYNSKTSACAIPKIVKLGYSIATDFDGLIVSCANDPGIEELNSCLSIPVNGPGRSTALLSLSQGRRVGVLGIREEPPWVFQEVLGEKLVAYRKPHNVANTNDLKTQQGRFALISAAHSLKEESVDVIALGCTGISTMMITPFLAADTGLPVIDPILAGGLFMYGQLLQQYQQK